MITEIQYPNQYVVVGTNYEGNHAGGAALYAKEHFGLQDGCGEGLSGHTYALPTMNGLFHLEMAAKDFVQFARWNPDKDFLLTAVGCGIAGHKPEDVAPFFKDAPSNVVLPEEFKS